MELSEYLLEMLRQDGEFLLWPAVGPVMPYTAYTQFVGVTQHGLYHAGQMALLKKALGSVDPATPRPN